jgi:hypothetical protein
MDRNSFEPSPLAPVDLTAAAGDRWTLVLVRDRHPAPASTHDLCPQHLLDGRPIGPIRGSAALDFGWSDLRSADAVKLTISGSP